MNVFVWRTTNLNVIQVRNVFHQPLMSKLSILLQDAKKSEPGCSSQLRKTTKRYTYMLKVSLPLCVGVIGNQCTLMSLVF